MIWIIQDSCYRHYNWVAMYEAVLACNSKALYCSVNRIRNLRQMAERPIVIGGDDFLDEARKNNWLQKGIFDDNQFFSVQAYKDNWGEDFLNCDTMYNSLQDLQKKQAGAYFIRPKSDKKCFDGNVFRLPDEYWKIQKVCGNCKLHDPSRLCICSAPAKQLSKEWRAIIIAGKIVDICRYAMDGTTNIDANDCPLELTLFINHSINAISSPIAWVLDVACSNGVMKVLECNIFNASNYYDCNRIKIVKALENNIENYVQV